MSDWKKSKGGHRNDKLGVTAVEKSGYHNVIFDGEITPINQKRMSLKRAREKAEEYANGRGVSAQVIIESEPVFDDSPTVDLVKVKTISDIGLKPIPMPSAEQRTKAPPKGGIPKRLSRDDLADKVREESAASLERELSEFAKIPVKSRTTDQTAMALRAVADMVGVPALELPELSLLVGGQTHETLLRYKIPLTVVTRQTAGRAAAISRERWASIKAAWMEHNSSPDRKFTIVLDGDSDLSMSLEPDRGVPKPTNTVSRRPDTPRNDPDGFERPKSHPTELGPSEGENKRERQNELCGHPVASVLRWMGKQGWTKEDAKVVLRAKRISDVNEAAVAIQVAAGRKGMRGDPARLTEDQEMELHKIVSDKAKKVSRSEEEE